MNQEAVVQGALQRRLESVDQEITDLHSLLAIMGRIERDQRLKELLRTADLGFRLQDLWAGRITGDRLHRALETLDALSAPTPTPESIKGLEPAR